MNIFGVGKMIDIDPDVGAWVNSLDIFVKPLDVRVEF